MSDISYVNLPDGVTYNITDLNALHHIIVPDYDATSTYNLNDFVTYNGNIYMCIAVIETPEVWISAHWRLVDADQSYLHSLNPKGAGSFSLNRKDNTTVGFCSFAEGYNTTASGGDSHAEGSNTTASGNFSHSEGLSTTANHRSQHTFGEYNILDASTATASDRGNYVEIVGNGTGPSARSNARTLDWSGNEVLAGGLKINSTQDVAAQVSLTQAEYDALVSAGTVDLVNTIYFITDADAIAGSASEITYSNTGTGLSSNTVQTAITEINSLIPSWIKQTPGTTFGAILPCIFFYYYADQWTAYVQLPFVMKNVNYSVSLDDVIAENIGSIVSKCSVVDKQYCYFAIRTTRTMPSLPDLYSTNGGRCRFTITFA